jgi:hypothetical protein
VTAEQKDTYRKALKESRTSYDANKARELVLTRELNAIKDENVRLRRTITALAAMCSESPGIDKLGITDAVREVMAEAPFDMTTQWVVDSLDSMGFDIDSQKNANASVHAVLSRLAKDATIKKIEDGDTVKWRGPNYAEITDEDIPF